MLAKQLVQYFLSKAVPGIINFLAIAIYTRLISPHDYGIYSMALVTASFLGLICFQWVQLSLLRFYSENVEKEDIFLRTIFYCFLVSIVPLVLVIPLIYLFAPSMNLVPLVILVALLAVVQGWFDLLTEVARVKMEPLRYGVMSFIRSVTSLSVSVIVIKFGGGFYGPLLGLASGSIFAVLFSGIRYTKNRLNIKNGERFDVGLYIKYGVPLVLTFGLSMVIAGTDRLMIGKMIDESAAGSYAAGFDFVWQLIILSMVIVNLAVYPITLNAYAKNGDEGAILQLSRNAPLLLALSMPLAIFIGVLAPFWTQYVLGAEFRVVALEIAPWVAAASVIAGLRSYHFDLAFQIKTKTKYQVIVVAVTAFINIVLNYFLINFFGVIGSAYATFFSYAISFVLSIFLGRKMLRVPLINYSVTKALVSSIIFALLLRFSLEFTGYLFCATVFLSCFVYLFILILLDFMGCREFLCKRFL